MADKLKKLSKKIRRSEQHIEELHEQIRVLSESLEQLLHKEVYSNLTKTQKLKGTTSWFQQTDDGWVVTLDGTNRRRSLPSHIKVDVRSQSDGRDNFQIKGGIYSTESGSISSGSGLLTTIDPHKVGAQIAFRDRDGGSKTIGGIVYDKQITIEYREGSSTIKKGPFNAKTDSDNPVPSGTHDLQIPDYPHPGGSSYGKYGTVWFRIGDSGDRYLHPGRISAGCITCEPSSWKEIYGTLIVRRNDSTSVGTIVVS